MQHSTGRLRFAMALMLCAWAEMVTPRIAWSAGETLLRCESQARETVRCRADTSRGVTLERQLSRAGCWFDETWGYDTRGIWVSNGCRADFALDKKAAVGPTSSTSNAAPSGSSGISGQDVAMGAAAALVVGAIAYAVIASRNDDDDDDDDDDRCRYRDKRGRCIENDPWERDKLVKCESPGRKQRYCRVDTRRGVELHRQLSKARCRYKSTWGYDRRGIWVDEGCRAQFLVRG